tara:strand:- start:295 stop:717 length:423 start_codon:yes stop_codon:yes gene_type:complete
MPEYTFRGYILGPQEYEPAYDKDGNRKEKNRKLPRDMDDVKIKASGSTEAEAKKKAIKEVKNSRQYSRFTSNISDDAPTKPRVQLTEEKKFYAKLDKKYNLKGAGMGSLALGPDLVKPDDDKYMGLTDNRRYRDLDIKGD